MRKLASRFKRLVRGFGQLPVWLRRAFGGLIARFRRVPAGDHGHLYQARSHPGSRDRRYVVHEPPKRDPGRALPLVMVLHGCRQDNRDIETITGFNELADRRGFLVVYPFVTSYRGLRNRNCWGWWFDREIHSGAGEVEDLWQIIEEVKRQYPVDANRIHVTGLSSGAGMAVAMMVAHSEHIASGAAVAGVPYAERATAARHALNDNPRNRPVVSIVKAMQDEMGASARLVPIQIVHSQQDQTVDLKSAEVLRDSWGHCFGINTRLPAKVTTGSDGDVDWEHSRYVNDAGESVIETLFLEGPGHGWYGGNPGDFSYPDAPDIKQGIWQFFKANPMRAADRRQVA